MICTYCDSEWWIEQRLIQPVLVSTDERLQSPPEATKYRLVCAECGKPPTHDQGEP